VCEPNDVRSEDSMPREIQVELEQLRASCINMLVRSQRNSPPTVERLRQHLWSATRELDSLLDSLHIPHSLDFEKGDDPATAKTLYDFVVWRYFTPHPTDDPGDIETPSFTPEEGELDVFYRFGRWFVTWIKLDEDMSRSEKGIRELLVITKEKDGSIVFNEV
jgi:hypothetical protein